jgi:homopolymeric O-antigen transport system ATP-binding protein
VKGDLVLSVEDVLKEYAPAKPAGARRFFTRFRGLQLDVLVGDLVGEEDEDEDYLEDDDDEQVANRARLGRVVIDRLSLQAYAGSHIAVVGPEGAGKTMLLKLIAGIVPPTRGRIVVRGRVAPALAALTPMFPKAHTLHAALPYVGAIVGLPPHVVRSRLDEIGDFLGVPKLRTVSTLSLDRRRRMDILLATMLSIDPDVVLTDIPIAADDFGGRCLRRLDELRAKGSVLITEARDEQTVLPAPDRIVRLDRGRVVADERPDPAPLAESAGGM